MKSLKTTLILIIGIVLTSGCEQQGPVAIQYGEEPCTFCKMTIMDSRFSCEMQTNTGKTYKFDDLFCLLEFKKANQNIADNIAHIFVSDFNTGEFVEHTNALFLFNTEFNSPMSGNMAAFRSDDLRNEVQNEKGGELFDWQQVIKKSDL